MKSKKSRQHAVKVEAPVTDALEIAKAATAELIATGTLAPESQETPAPESQETPAVETPEVETTAKPAKKRYASIAVLANPNAVITKLAPNPKRDPNSKTHKKYNLFKVGLSVKEVEEAFVAAGWPRMKARNQLRWDIEHGYVELGIKEESEAAE
jgi:hypothetical protein